MNWFRKFMYGRYGVDELSMSLLIVSIILMVVLGWLPGVFKTLSAIAYIPMIIYVYRTFSKNIFKRQQEYYKYLSFKNSSLSKLKKYKKEFKIQKHINTSNVLIVNKN